MPYVQIKMQVVCWKTWKSQLQAKMTQMTLLGLVFQA